MTAPQDRRSSSLGQPQTSWQHCSSAFCCLALATACAWAQSNGFDASIEELKWLSFEQLMNQEVTLVSRRPEKWFTSPSAEQVITREDIRRSGATSIPE